MAKHNDYAWVLQEHQWAKDRSCPCQTLQLYELSNMHVTLNCTSAEALGAGKNSFTYSRVAILEINGRSGAGDKISWDVRFENVTRSPNRRGLINAV